MEKSPTSRDRKSDVFCRALRITSDRGAEHFVISGPARKDAVLFTAEFSREHNGWLAVAEVAKIPRGPNSPINQATRYAIQLLKLERRVKSYEWVNN